MHPRPASAMLVTDLDGTLLRSDGRIDARDEQMLHDLGARGVHRVIATGRSPFSFWRVIPRTLPIDTVILSSGVGIVDFRSGEVLRTRMLNADQAKAAAQRMRDVGLDFMVHDAFPENHRFAYWTTGATNEDFVRRMALYQDHARPLNAELAGLGEVAQLLAVLPPGDPTQRLQQVKGLLAGASVVRTTSPLDHRSTWIEVFAPGVSKGDAAGWVAQRLGVAPTRTLAVGNDFNDLDLLDWAAQAWVVDNAPQELRERYSVARSHDDAGVAAAVESWLVDRGG